jgi:hypothetical protein
MPFSIRDFDYYELNSSPLRLWINKNQAKRGQ